MTAPFEPGPIPCEGAVFGDFRLTAHLPPDAAPEVIDRDRRHMAARPGFNRKLLPLHVEPASGLAYSGGRYLLDTYADARAFADWVRTGFRLDGTLFLDRPAFAEPAMRAFRVLGACDFKDVRRAQHICRTETWSLTRAGAAERVATGWPALQDEAREQGRSGLWLVLDETENLLSLLTIAERLPGSDRGSPDFASLEALAAAPSQGTPWERDGSARRVFDRTDWVFNIWFPHVAGRDREAPVWPNSPPLPALAGARPDAASPREMRARAGR